jgi:type I restriction enzyme M protein
MLAPGRFVGAPEAEEDEVAYEERMTQQTEALAEDFKKAEVLTAEVKRALAAVGYDV